MRSQYCWLLTASYGFLDFSGLYLEYLTFFTYLLGDWEHDRLKKSSGNALFDTFNLIERDRSGETTLRGLVSINIIVS